MCHHQKTRILHANARRAAVLGIVAGVEMQSVWTHDSHRHKVVPTHKNAHKILPVKHGTPMKRAIIILLVAMATVVVASVAYFVVWPLVSMGVGIHRDVQQSMHERVQLLFQTDHRALLAGCREVMMNRTNFINDKSWHGTEDSAESYIDPSDPKLPAVITNLKPSYIIASDTELSVELYGGFDHYGVTALSERTAKTNENDSSGPFELIPGLLYYDEGLNANRAAWMQKLKKMKPHDAPAPTW